MPVDDKYSTNIDIKDNRKQSNEDDASSLRSSQLRGSIHLMTPQQLLGSAHSLRNNSLTNPKMTNRRTPMLPLPDVRDKGYAWLTIFVMFISNVITAGYIKSFGVFYNEIVKAYPGTSEASAGLLMALLAGCRGLMALFVGAAAVKFGPRSVMMVGVLFCSSGLFLSVWCTSIFQLAFTLGAMMGTGMCCIETCQVHVLSDYFHEKKELANSLRVSGNPLGGAALPFLLIFLVDYFGLKYTYFVLSAMLLQLAVLVMLLRPYKVHQRIVHLERIDKLVSSQLVEEECKLQEVQNKKSDDVVQPKEEKSKMIDMKLLKNPLYMTHIGMILFLAMALPHFQFFLPRYGLSINLTQAENSALLAFQSVLDSATRILIGLLLNKKLFMKTRCFIVCQLIGATGIAIIPFSRGFWPCLLGVGLFSFGSAGWFATIHVILLDQFGKGNISSSFGFIRTLQGVINFAYPPLLGLLRDSSGDYTATFLTMSFGMIGAGAMMASQPLVIRAANLDTKLQ